ncbi:hypothetical protein GCM10009765_17750 [Fodinicola feengrottensis]|uniref:DNA alkylation repair protein n=1 Tax=Fodinicola feengrottensis TaxID=435914 RepID=A0ABP4SA04_9ACTN
MLAATPAYERAPDPVGLIRDDPIGVDQTSLGVIARASTLRQLGRYLDARKCDEAAERAVENRTLQASARLGLAADAVGTADPSLARQWLAAAGSIEDAAVRVLAGWVATEIALMSGDASAAVSGSAECVSLARQAGLRWHLAKSLLFAGVAQVVGGRAEAGLGDLVEAAAAARAYPAPAVGWVVAAVLADHDPNRRQAWHAEAVAAVGEIADGLPSDVRLEWLGRSDVRRFTV